MNPYIIKPIEYRNQVLIAKQVNRTAENLMEKDQKKKFLMRGYPPTVEQLEAHNAEDNFQKYFPYLLFYHEPDICNFIAPTEEFAQMQDYLDNIFKENLVMETGVRLSPYKVTDDEYDRALENNVECAEHAFRLLDAYEQDIFSFGHELTLERLKSADIAVNIERFLPFLLQIAEPSLSAGEIVKSGRDWPLIKKYVNGILYENLEFS